MKAIVLRVNSPGGSALTSDMVHHAIEKIEKPLIVSQANYAASGGYYISCNADAIFTNSTTVTGSIGIFMSLFTAERLMSETLGLHVEEVQTHPLANFDAVRLRYAVNVVFCLFLIALAAGGLFQNRYHVEVVLFTKSNVF